MSRVKRKAKMYIRIEINDKEVVVNDRRYLHESVNVHSNAYSQQGAWVCGFCGHINGPGLIICESCMGVPPGSDSTVV